MFVEDLYTIWCNPSCKLNMSDTAIPINIEYWVQKPEVSFSYFAFFLARMAAMIWEHSLILTFILLSVIYK